MGWCEIRKKVDLLWSTPVGHSSAMSSSSAWSTMHMALLPLCSYPLASEAGHDDEKAGEQDEEGEDPAGLHRVDSDGRLVGGEQRGEALYAAEVEQTHDVDWQAVRLLQSLAAFNGQTSAISSNK